MKTAIPRDSILTVVGFSLITGVFLFAFYLPGLKLGAQIKADIKVAEEAIKNVPLRVAELELLQNGIAARKAYIAKAREAIPTDPDVHGVIRQVADLARNSNLQITRLEPRTAVSYASFQELPFRMSFSGPFRNVATFLKGMESRGRLFAVQEFTLKQKDERNGKPVEGDLHFSVFIDDAEIADSDGNNGRVP